MFFVYLSFHILGCLSCLCRWAQFRQCIEVIETNMKALRAGESVGYKQHIGGVSITSGFYCVDIRKFFIPYGETNVKPTRRGIALRLWEWEDMKKIIDAINNAYPTLGTALRSVLGSNLLQVMKLQ